MNSGDKSAVTRIAIIDGIVALVVLFISVALTTVTSTSDIPWMPVSVVLISVAVLLGWRGAADVRRRLNGDHRWWRAPLDGFLSVAAVVFLWLMTGAVTTAMAAGPIYQDAASWTPREWMLFVGFAAAMSAACGTVGAMLGMIIGSLNRMLLQRH